MRRYLWLVFAILLLIGGIAVGRLLKLQQPMAQIVATVPPFLATFPFMKRWMPKAKFYYWLTAAGISTAAALLYFKLVVS